MTVRFLVDAEAELADAAAHYDGLLPGLGAEFALEVRNGLTRIEQYPKAWQLLGRRARRYRLSRFPYGLVYAPLPSEIVVLAGHAPSPKARLLERAVDADLTQRDSGVRSTRECFSLVPCHGV